MVSIIYTPFSCPEQVDPMVTRGSTCSGQEHESFEPTDLGEESSYINITVMNRIPRERLIGGNLHGFG